MMALYFLETQIQNLILHLIHKLTVIPAKTKKHHENMY